MNILTDPTIVLQKYLQINTTDSQNDRQACQFWSSIFSQYHVKNHLLQSGDYYNFETYTSFPAGEKILLQNHLDVVPANSNNWDFDPFGGEIHDGYLYGRGALDMKSIAVAQAYAFLKLVNENHPRKDLLKFCSLVQEETTSKHGAEFYVDYLQQQGYKNLIVLGEGGFSLSIPEIFDGVFFLYEAEQKGMLWLSITVFSKGGHGSLSSQSRRKNPVIRAGKVAQKLNRLKFPIKVEASVELFIKSIVKQNRNFIIKMIFSMPGVNSLLFNTRLGTALIYRVISRATGIPDLFRTSLNVTNIHTNKILGLEEKAEPGRFDIFRIFRRSTKRKINPITQLGVNIIPSYATLTCDIRFNSVYSMESLINEIKLIIPKDATLTVLDSHEFSSSDYHIVQNSLQPEMEKIYSKDAILSPFLFIANSDNYFFRTNGHHAFGLVPIITQLDELQRIHGDNERINIQDFKDGCELYYRMLKVLVEKLQV